MVAKKRQKILPSIPYIANLEGNILKKMQQYPFSIVGYNRS